MSVDYLNITCVRLYNHVLPSGRDIDWVDGKCEHGRILLNKLLKVII
jgi:hypothetical protein